MTIVEWKLVKDDKVHWHYEKVERKLCCDLMNLERICQDCPGVDDGEPAPVWHAAPYCPFCRGPGVSTKEGEGDGSDPSTS